MTEWNYAIVIIFFSQKKSIDKKINNIFFICTIKSVKDISEMCFREKKEMKKLPSNVVMIIEMNYRNK